MGDFRRFSHKCETNVGTLLHPADFYEDQGREVSQRSVLAQNWPSD